MSMKRTGKVRWRSQRRWGKEELILQVELSGTEAVNYGFDIGMEDRTYWRDARSEDMWDTYLATQTPAEGG